MAKLTKAQRELLAFCEEIGGGMYASGGRGLVALSLVRRGFFSKLTHGPYFVTPAGREALTHLARNPDQSADAQRPGDHG